MSSLIVEIVKIDKVEKHPYADALDLIHIKGWQSITKINEFKENDVAVYFPLDSLLPEELSDAIGVTQYLSKGRVRAAKLRGVPSYGFCWPIEKFKEYVNNDIKYEVGDNVAELLGVTKWEPPIILNSMNRERDHPEFFRYTDIENMRNYPDIIEEGEEVIITEKIHGTNHRFGLIDSIFMAGTHNTRQKENPNNKYWYVVNDNMKAMVNHFSDKYNQNIIIYNEIFGFGIQDLQYGMKDIDFRCFDIRTKNRYLDWQEVKEACQQFDIKTVPVLYQGKFSFDKIKEIEEMKNTTINNGCNLMEGVVVKPLKERNDFRIGRVILKYVFDAYLNRKKGTEYH